MNADAAQLDALGKLLIKRAADLSYAGRKLASESYSANWQCAKADRYQAAMEARATETRRLSRQMRELGNYLRARAGQMEAAAAQTPPGGAP